MNRDRVRLLSNYSNKKLPSMSTYGIWEVRGEDPNPDMGGSHHEPHLGYYEGILDEVVDLAVTLPGMWQWGAGGSIKQVQVQKLDSKEFKRQQEVRKRIEQTEKQLAALKDELNGV